MTYAKDYTVNELMAATVARQIKNDDVVFIGMGIPLIAGVIATKTHAPDAVLLFEGGGIGAKTRRIPWSIADNPTTDNALAARPMWSLFMDCSRGFVTKAVTGGAEIDRYGNLNSSVIPGVDGSYLRPKVRLPGSGGANDLASSANETIIMMRLQKGKFVERVTFITSPGYLAGAGERERWGLKGKGPLMVVTNRCVFKFDQQTKEMYLDSLFPGATAQEIQEFVDWDLKIPDNLVVVEPPTEEQIQLMHNFDSTNIILGKPSKPDSFIEYYTNMKKAYNAIAL